MIQTNSITSRIFVLSAFILLLATFGCNSNQDPTVLQPIGVPGQTLSTPTGVDHTPAHPSSDGQGTGDLPCASTGGTIDPCKSRDVSSFDLLSPPLRHSGHLRHISNEVIS